MLQGKLRDWRRWEKKKWEVGSWIGVDDVAEKLVAGNQQAIKLAAAAAALLPQRRATQTTTKSESCRKWAASKKNRTTGGLLC